MKKDISILGAYIGQFKVIKQAQSDIRGNARWIIKCAKCGEERIVRGTDARKHLKNKISYICSCEWLERKKITADKYAKKAKERALRVAAAKEYKKIKDKNILLYYTWKGMKARCYRKTHPKYIHYGMRGIYVCDEWRNNFIAFYQWSLTNGYRQGLTIDRINNDDGYRPDNCRWTTYSVQNSNKRYRA